MLPQDRLKFGPLTATLKDGSILTLRLLEPGDADVLGDFYESIPREDHRHYAPHKLNRMQARIKAEKMADSEHFICVIAVDKSKQIAGYAWCLWKRPEDESSVLGICIRRNYQRLGTGRSIMQRLLEIVRQAGGRTAGVAMLVDRSAGVARFEVPSLSLLELSFPTYPADQVPAAAQETRGGRTADCLAAAEHHQVRPLVDETP